MTLIFIAAWASELKKVTIEKDLRCLTWIFLIILC